MAKVITPLTGTLSVGSYSVYTPSGSNKPVVRRKGGPNKEQFYTEPSMARNRRSATHFGACSLAAAMIKNSMFNVHHLNDQDVKSKLHSICNAIIYLNDEFIIEDQRSLIFSKGLHLLQGFNLSKNNPFDSVFTTPISCSLDRSLHKATVYVPPISPGHNLMNPWNLDYYRLRFNLAILRDLEFVKGIGYRPVTADVLEYAEGLDLEWQPFDASVSSQQVEMQLQDPVFDDSCHLLFTAGVEFGKKVNGLMRTQAHKGTARVLAIA